jgi:hypothetical protein
MDAEELLRLNSHLAGQASSLERAAAEARKTAGVYFGAGSDDRAKHWREVAQLLDGLAAEARKKQAKFT